MYVCRKHVGSVTHAAKKKKKMFPILGIISADFFFACIRLKTSFWAIILFCNGLCRRRLHIRDALATTRKWRRRPTKWIVTVLVPVSVPNSAASTSSCSESCSSLNDAPRVRFRVPWRKEGDTGESGREQSSTRSATRKTSRTLST